MEVSSFRYQRIAEDATARFLHDYKPGEMVMSEGEMLEFYGVARNTVRQARGLMVASGKFYVRQGAGMFVASPHPDKNLPRAMQAAIALHDRRCMAPEPWGASYGDWSDMTREHRDRDIADARVIMRRGSVAE